MDSKASSTVPEAKKESKRAQDSSELDPTQQSLHGKYFSSQEMCYLAHHVNEAHDFRSLCRMFNTQFGPDRALQSVEKFLERCDEALFIALTEKAQDYKWCKPHPISSILPPTIVLGTADWRTELRAFLVFQTSKDVSLAELDESLSATFPEESRTSMQIKTQLGQINKKPGLFLYLEWFAARYPWHSDYVAGASTSKPPTMKFKTDTRAAARARLSQGKEKPTNYKDKEAALDDQLELTQ